MKDKVISLVLGFILSLAVVFTAMYFFTKADNPANAKQQDLFSQSTVDSIKQDTTPLQNYGSLPISVGGDQIGRGNPFEAYK